MYTLKKKKKEKKEKKQHLEQDNSPKRSQLFSSWNLKKDQEFI